MYSERCPYNGVLDHYIVLADQTFLCDRDAAANACDQVVVEHHTNS